MSEYLDDVELHERSDSVTIRFRYDDEQYSLTMGWLFFEQLKVNEGQKSPVVMEVMVFDEED